MSQPSAYEQYLLELINAARIKGGVQPLAGNSQLNDAADSHVDWMISSNVFSHTGAGGSSAYDRIVASGFTTTGSWSWGENIVWESVRGAAGYADEVRDLHNWLMNSPGHYANIMKASFTQVGLGFNVGPFQGWQSAVSAEDFIGSSQHFLTGVAYNDLNGDRAYQPGEGLGGLTVTAIAATTGSQKVMQTYSQGGYDMALAAGTYTVTISGPDIAPFTQQVTIGSLNVKLDLVSPGAAPVPGPAPISGTSGADTLTAPVNTGADSLNGLGGDDRLTGGGGNDVLDGGTGADDLFGDTGNDTLLGGDGADELNGGAGADRLEGGLGNDTYYVDSTGDVVVESTAGSAGGGADKVISTVSFTLGANVERLTLSGAAEIEGTGNTLGNIIYGNGAANRLTGLSGSDLISANSGNDTLVGGTGGDTLTGGAGADRFLFAKGEVAGDVIKDFALGDVIQLTGYSAGSTIAKVAGSTTDWLVTDGATHATELLKLANSYALKTGDFLFG